MSGCVEYYGDRCVKYGIDVGDHVGTSHARYVKVPSLQSLFPLHVIGVELILLQKEQSKQQG
eukprot:12657007-Ditylum_brightwellii.AAC.1